MIEILDAGRTLHPEPVRRQFSLRSHEEGSNAEIGKVLGTKLSVFRLNIHLNTGGRSAFSFSPALLQIIQRKRNHESLWD